MIISFLERPDKGRIFYTHFSYTYKKQEMIS
nr:MAG TPA: hypothetical protein [Caudoviricetes sp.]